MRKPVYLPWKVHTFEQDGGALRRTGAQIIAANCGHDPVTEARYLPIAHVLTVGDNCGQWRGITQEQAEANAAHIVKCVNSHETLLECLKGMHATWRYIRDNYPDVEIPEELTGFNGRSDFDGRTRAAIRAVEGGSDE